MNDDLRSQYNSDFSELIINYGLFYDEFDAQKLAKEVSEWWNDKS